MNEKENHLPNLSDKERAHALELAMKARKRRAVLKARMKSGELAFTDALNEEDAKRMASKCSMRGKRSASSRVRWRRLWKSRKPLLRSEGKQTATTSKSESTILITQMQSRKDK